MRLYSISFDLTGDASHHLITSGYFPLSETPGGAIGVVPAGHKVCFREVYREYSGDGVSESLRGTTVFSGISYPVTYWLGFAHDSGSEGWERIYKSFKMPDSQ